MKKFFLFVAAAVMAVNVMAELPVDEREVKAKLEISGEDGFVFHNASYTLQASLFTKFDGAGTYEINAERNDNVSYEDWSDPMNPVRWVALSGTIVVTEIEKGYQAVVEADATTDPDVEKPEADIHFSWTFISQNLPLVVNIYDATINSEVKEDGMESPAGIVAKNNAASVFINIASGMVIAEGEYTYADLNTNYASNFTDKEWDDQYYFTEFSMSVKKDEHGLYAEITGTGKDWQSIEKEIKATIYCYRPTATATVALGEQGGSVEDKLKDSFAFIVSTYVMDEENGKDYNMNVTISNYEGTFDGEYGPDAMWIKDASMAPKISVIAGENTYEADVLDGSAIVTTITESEVDYLQIQMTFLVCINGEWTNLSITIKTEKPLGPQPIEGDNSIVACEEVFEDATVEYKDGYAYITGENENCILNLEFYIDAKTQLEDSPFPIQIVDVVPMMVWDPVLVAGNLIPSAELGDDIWEGSYVALKGEGGVKETPAWFITTTEGAEFSLVTITKVEKSDKLKITIFAYNSYAIPVSVEATFVNPATGCENAEAAVKVVKAVENGQLIINRGGEKYNVVGAKL